MYGASLRDSHSRLGETQLQGFTLVELLVVIAIIGVLIALFAAGGPSGAGSGQTDRVRQSSAAAWIGLAQLRRRQEVFSGWSGKRLDRSNWPMLPD